MKTLHLDLMIIDFELELAEMSQLRSNLMTIPIFIGFVGAMLLCSWVLLNLLSATFQHVFYVPQGVNTDLTSAFIISVLLWVTGVFSIDIKTK